MGDPAGVGPETIVAAWRHPGWHRSSQACVIGSAEVLQRASARFAPDVQVLSVSRVEEAASSPSCLPCLDVGPPDAAAVAPATIDPRGGQTAYNALCAAARLALAGRVAAIVTAPLHKAALHAAGHHYPGHTELLAELCGVREFAMMLYLAHGERIQGRVGLGVIHVTLHMALRDIFSRLSTAAIFSKIRLAHEAMVRFLPAGAAPPRIGVCALNPHAGEQGLFGDEETRLIAPAVSQARTAGLAAHGPLPADTLLVQAADGMYDAVVAMYHDQGHIALKLLGMHRAVNVTLGLPIVRTSVAHGTAFDLAWQGTARHDGLLEAIRVATMLAK
jgi:4-hydroxythreonine-4-phosphate dehydrogenase